jgi:hypothetical protein
MGMTQEDGDPAMAASSRIRHCAGSDVDEPGGPDIPRDADLTAQVAGSTVPSVIASSISPARMVIIHRAD